MEAAGAAEEYDAIPYESLAYPLSHPDHIAAVVTMFGLATPPVATARVLEVGCGDGANLLPMAAALPRARFVGCDIAPGVIEHAQRSTSALGLSNIAFREADLTTIDDGPYDYIIAHGVYSWVPEAVRDGLLALADRLLTREGILLVSYNTYPGGFVRRAAWEALRWHVRGVGERRERLRAAREFAAMLGEPASTHEQADAAVRAEWQRVAEESDSLLYHDTLAEPNQPVFFHQFVEHAKRHRLTYVAEALPSMMAGGGLPASIRRFIAAQDRLAREQYLDFARVRRFRQSLVCREQHADAIRPTTTPLRSLHVSASMPLMRAAADAKIPSPAGAQGDVIRRMLEALVDHAPRARPVAQLFERLSGTSDAAPLHAALFESWLSGFAQLHADPIAIARTSPARPRVFAVARWQAPMREAVTNLRHETIRLVDPFARTLVPLCDGTRGREALCVALSIATDDSARRAQLEDTLAMLAQCALLEDD
ncbi:MAG TPA: class I SAM-dependent methyltransferase [Casimicrobiaceae bacterium]|nr:class I SAM-dependent methyltransferase [Casimicrobiaceae bacterium]